MANSEERPVRELRAGHVYGAVFAKTVTRDGRAWVQYQARILRRFKNERTNAWSSTSYFPPDDLCDLALVASKVYEFIRLRELPVAPGPHAAEGTPEAGGET